MKRAALGLVLALAAAPAFALTISLSAPAANAVFQTGATVTLSATVTPTTGRAVTKVEFFRSGTTLIGTDTTSPYSFAWASVPAGSYSITAKATDSSGATATTTARTIKVNAPPAVTLTAPANGAVFSPGATIALAATATDSDGTISKVEFLRGGTTLIGSDTASPYSFSWTNVAAGSYALTARATDSNTGVTTSSAVNIVVDAAPTVSLTAPAANAVFLPGATVTVTATAADADGTVAKVEFFDGATLAATVTAAPFTAPLSGLAVGTHSLTAKATDNLGRATTSAAVSVRVDAPPTVSITAPTNNSVFASPASFTLSATAADADGTVAKVEFFEGPTLVGTATAAPYNLALVNVASGAHAYTAKATDNNGAATTSAGISVTVNTAPTVSITSPANNAVLAAPGGFALAATAADADGTIAKVEFFEGATLLGTSTSAPYGVSLANVAAGTHAYTAKATDNLGAATTSSAISVLAEAPPTVSITAPAGGTVLASPASFTITATAADSDGTVSKVEFFDGATLVGTVTAAPYNLALANVASGAHPYTARATDNNGLATTSAAVSVIVNTAPTVNISSPAANATLSSAATVTIAASAADADGTIAKVEFFQGATLIGTATSAPYSVAWSGMAVGSYSLTAKATDDRGSATTSAAVPATVVAPSFSGSRDTGDCTSFSGWAWDGRQPNTPINVDVYVGTTLVATVLAGNFRQDLKNLGFGDGNHGFSFATPSQAFTGTSQTIAIKFGGTQTNIPGSPSQINCVGPGQPTPSYSGFHDSATCTAISGWALDTVRPNTPINVDVYLDNAFLMTAPADQFRGDLPGNHVHAFSFATPNVVKNNVAHSILVRFPGTTTALPGSPKTLTCFNALPSVTMTAPAANASFTAPASITLAAIASDPDGTIQKVDFFDGATLVGTATSAPFQVTIGNVQAGSHSFTARAMDSTDATTTSAAVTVTVNGAPGVNITTPANNAVFTAPASVTVTATASDADGSVAKVEFFDGAGLVGTATATPYSVTLSNLALGAHSLTARATDNQGAVLISAAVNIVVNAAPAVALTSPERNTVFGAPASVSLTATASDSDGTVAKVDFYQGTTLVGTSTAAPYSFAWTNVAAGSYSLTAVATDDRGGTATSTAVPITVTAQTAVGLTAPADGAVFPAPGSINLTASATVLAGGSIARVEFYQGASLIGTSTAAPYSFAWSNVASGTYALTAVLVDGNGAITSSSAVTVKVNAAPSVAITSPTTGANATAPASVTVSADAVDADGTVASVAFYRNGVPITTLTAPPYSFSWTGVPAGSYVLTAVATDDLGSSATSSAVTVLVGAGGAQTYFIETDHLNTPRVIEDKSQNLVWSWDNTEPFGDAVPNDSPSGFGAFEFNPRGAGQYSDRETGILYNYFRYLDPTRGQYEQSDPIGLVGGINTYLYVGASPLSRFDRFGLAGEDVFGNAGTRGGPYVPGPSDVFVPGTPANRAFGRSIGQIIQAIKETLCPSDDSDRCKEVLKTCRKECLDKFVRDPNSLPGTGSDLAGRQRRCIRDCMERNNCFDF